MKMMKTLLAATALVASLSGAAYAKTLIYCSEGAPEGFEQAGDIRQNACRGRLLQFGRGPTKGRIEGRVLRVDHQQRRSPFQDRPVAGQARLRHEIQRPG